MKKILFLLIALVMCSLSYAQLSGTYNVPGNYADLAAAITDLNSQGVSGNVTINLVAGNPQTAPAGGYVIGGTGSLLLTTTGSSAQVFIQGNGNTITASAAHTAGALNDAIFKVIGADYITLQGFTMQENDANTVTTAASNNMTEFGVALFYVTATDGCQYNTISNCTIDLNRTYQNTFGIYSNSTHSATAMTTSATATGTLGGNHGLVITGNTITDVNLGIVVVGPTAAADMNQTCTIGGSLANSNQITNFGTTGTFSSYANVSGTVNGIIIRNTLNYTISYNNIASSVGGVTAGTLNGIQQPAFSNTPSGAFTNSINNNTISLQSGVAASAMNGINCPSGSASTTSSFNINNNNFQNFGHTVAASGAITFILNASTHLNQSISNNTFTNITVNTTGSVTFISNTNTLPAAGVKNINYNSIVTAFNKTGAGGTVTLFVDNGSDPATATNNTNNNNFSNITVTGATTIAGWGNTNGGSPIKNVTGNTFSNWVGGTSSITCLSINYDGGTTTATNNLVNNITNGAAITGIAFGSSGGGVTNASQNTIYGLNGSATGAVYGISVAGGIRNISRNNIYDLTNTNAGGVVAGLYISGGTTIYAYNNFISDIKAPNLNAAISLYGIYVSGGTTIGLFYNTVYLNATSSGALFGSAALYASTTPTLDLRNNILVNVSTPNGAGITAAFRRSSATLTTYASTSNNNCFYAGPPGTYNLIMYDGTNSYQDMTIYKTAVTPRDSYSFRELPPFVGGSPYNLHLQTTVATQCESGGTPITTPIAITDDFDGNTRNAATPDVGADEGGFTPLDLNPPSISYTTLGVTSSLTARTLNVTVTDPSGVPATSPGWPNLYWKINYTGTYAAATPTGVASSVYTYSFGSGVALGDTVYYYVVAQDGASTPNIGAYPSAGAGNFTANPPAAGTPPTSPSKYVIVGLPLSGDYTVGTAKFNQVTGHNIYFEQVVKKVMKEVAVTPPSSTPEKGKEEALAPLDMNQGVKEMREVEEITWVPMENGSPYTGELFLKKSDHPEVDFPDGTKGVYTTITAAVNDLNARGVSGPVRFLLTDPSYSTGETFPIVFNIVSEALPTATNTVTIKPNTGVTSVITGSGNPSIFYLYGSDYIIFDGSNASGNDQNLTIENTYTTALSAVLILANNGTGATNNIVKNCIIKGSSNTVTNAYGLFLNASGGYFDNTTFTNNAILRCYIGMQFVGVSGGLTTGGLVSGNTLGSITDAESIGYLGIQLGYVDGVTVSNNLIQNLKVGNTPYGIYVGTGVVNTKINANKITDIAYAGTAGYGARGIYINTGSATSNLTFSNNMISKIGGDGYSSFSNASPVGMYFDGTTGGLKIYHNSVNMSGTLTYNAATLSTAILFSASTITNIDVRDNIFVNSLNNSSNTGAKNYAIYSSAPSGSFANINYNDYFVSGTQGILGYLGGDKLDFASWQTATSQDANSVSVDPKFQSATDLHIITSYPNVNNIGQYLAAVPTDFDGDTRSLTTPDLGADEYTYVAPTVDPPLAFSATAASSTQIDLTFTSNASNNNVVIVWNLTGTFTDPTVPPVLNGSLAGGTVLSTGTTSPVNHSGLPVSAHYYYKAFCYDGSNYSSGLTADATTFTPVLTVAPSSLVFGYIPYPGTSTEQTYALSGTNLVGTGNITVTAPAAFQVSLTAGTGFGSSVLVPFTGPTLAATTIYVRFVPAAASTAYSGNITNDGGSAAVKNVAVSGSSDINAAYCIPTSNCGSGDQITNVIFAGIDNTSTCGTNGYNDFTGGAPASVTQGNTYSFTGTMTNGGTEYMAIWIDFNQNGSFDASEYFYVGSGAGGTFTVNIAIPVSASIGTTRLRVRMRYSTTLAATDACTIYAYGETEDYAVNISVASTPALSATPGTLSLGYASVGGTTAPQSYALTGLALSPASGNIVVTAPPMFQVSLTSGSGYASSINVPYTGGTMNATVYAVFAPTAAGTYSEIITNAGGGASADVAVSGTTSIVYCSAGATSTSYEKISRIQFNEIDNSSTSTAGYEDFTSVSTNVTQGAGYSFTGTISSGYETDQFLVWIDFNQNGDFTDAGEQVYISSEGIGPHSGTINIPATAVLGSTRMRVRMQDASYGANSTPCGTSSYGQVEDYTVLVNPQLAHDVGIVSIDNLTSPLTVGTVVAPKATIANYGTNTETFTVTMTSNPGTYTSTQAVTALAPGATVQLTFADWTAVVGSYVLEATAELESDLNSDNNKKSFSVDVFEAGNGTWTTGADLSLTTGHYLGSGVGYVDNSGASPVGFLFTAGGNDTPLTDFLKYNITTDTWTTLTSLPEGRVVHTSSCVGNYIYVIGGSDGTDYVSTVYKYDINANTWATVAPLPNTIAWCKAVSKGNYIYVAGGVDGDDNVVSSVFVYNTTTDTWLTATTLPGPRFAGAFSCTGDKLVYAGGVDDLYVYSTLYVGTISATDPAVITWETALGPEPLAPTKVARDKDNATSTTLTTSSAANGNKSPYPPGIMWKFDAAPWGEDGIIITTGTNGTTDPDWWYAANPNPCFVYKPATNSWIQQPNLPIPVLASYLGSVDINNSGTHTWKLLVSAGINASGSVIKTTQILTESFAPPTKTLNLKLYLEGFIKSRGGVLPAAGFMYKTQLSDGSTTTDAFAGTVVDTLTVALAASGSPYSIVYYKHNAELNSNGTMTINVPASYSSSYYIVIKHRQYIETWSAIAVPFNNSAISYDFSTAASQAYGNNQVNLGASWGYGMYAGDIVKDGYIELAEVNATYTSARNAQYGYLLYDFTGNGFVELDDVNLIYTNYRNGKSFLWPGGLK